MAEEKKKSKTPRSTCSMCGRERSVAEFWKTRDGSPFHICKDCACMNIDVSKPKTFMWILKETDRPFIEELWVNVCKRQYMKDPETFSPKSAFGIYYRSITNLPRFSKYTFADTEELNRPAREKRERAAALAAKMEEAEEKLAASSDKESMDATLDVTTVTPQEKADVARRERKRERLAANRHKSAEAETSPTTTPSDSSLGTPDPAAVDEQNILDNLTPQDTQYLALKWGESFRPSEWVKMEEMYKNYCQEFEIGVDRESVLIAMCKTSINMQRCLDSGDAANASKFSSMFDQLRKSGAFTEAQKKDDKQKYLDSVGELVAAVEREGGVIPQFDYQFEVNQDKVDLTLKDMQAYTYNLVKNEMGLGDLIETYIKKLDQQREEEKSRRLDEGLIIGNEEEERERKNDVIADDFIRNLEDSIASEADSIYSKIGDDV